jgi:hypothetical protein
MQSVNKPASELNPLGERGLTRDERIQLRLARMSDFISTLQIACEEHDWEAAEGFAYQLMDEANKLYPPIDSAMGEGLRLGKSDGR